MIATFLEAREAVSLGKEYVRKRQWKAAHEGLDEEEA